MVAALPGLRAGLNCVIAIESADGFGEYKSRVEDFEGDRLMLAMPSSRGALIVPSTGDALQIQVPISGGATIFLDGEVVGRVTQPVPIVVVRVLAVGQQQARGYFRINIVVRPLDCVLWDISGGPEQAFWRPVKATIQDMSGGGVGLQADEAVPEGARMKVRFPLPYGGGECAAAGEVKLSRAVQQGNRGTRWTLGLQFSEINRRSRERLIKAIHRYQAEERRLTAPSSAD